MVNFFDFEQTNTYSNNGIIYMSESNSTGQLYLLDGIEMSRHEYIEEIFKRGESVKYLRKHIDYDEALRICKSIIYKIMNNNEKIHYDFRDIKNMLKSIVLTVIGEPK